MDKPDDEYGFKVTSRAEIAQYKPQVIPEYKNNPFIEALPSILSREEAIEQLCVYPEYNTKERFLDSHFRYHLIQRLFRYFQPLPQHIDLEQKISRLLRQGYLARNPMSNGHPMALQQVRKHVLEANDSVNRLRMYEIHQLANSFVIMGISGIGKTTSIERVLSLYPQIIVHETPLNLYQLVWLKLDCPFDGSVKGLCVQFFSKVDELFGTNYKGKFASSARQSVDMMLPNMAHVAYLHGVGLLVIDEIQHLSAAKSGGAEKMLNFFVTLVNTIGIPVISIGTPKALPILQSEFRQARRGTGQGNVVWNCMKRNINWELLIEGIWEYQWTRKESMLTEEMHNVLYEESQGIVDIAIKLYMLSQICAISTGVEVVTPELVSKVAKESLQLVRPMLKDLKSDDLLELAKYDDIKPIDMDAEIQRYVQIGITERIRLQRRKEAEKREQQGSTLEKVLLELLRMEIEPSIAQKAAEQVVVKHGDSVILGIAVKEALQLVFELEKSFPEDSSVTATKTQKQPKRKKKEPVSNDPQELRIIIDRGREKQQSAYESLREAGYIKAPIEDFAI